MAVQRIQKLEKLVSEMVGDSGKPNLFFVTLEGQCILIARDFSIAHRTWVSISRGQRTKETTLEDRQTGIIASNGIEEMEDGTEKWMYHDDSRMHGFDPQAIY
jgi:hypothetical protein